jgi:hypothetical protein
MDFVNCLDGEGKLGKNRKNRADKGLCKQEMIATQKQKIVVNQMIFKM